MNTFLQTNHMIFPSFVVSVTGGMAVYEALTGHPALAGACTSAAITSTFVAFQKTINEVLDRLPDQRAGKPTAAPPIEKLSHG